MNEKSIIERAQTGDDGAFRQLYVKYREMIYRTAYRYMKSRELAEDIMQETFIKAFDKINKFSIDKNPTMTAWLSRICINCCIGHLRKQKSFLKNRTIVLSEVSEEPVSKMKSPEESTDSDQTSLLIKGALKKLSLKQKVIFDLRHRHHKEIKEIAAIMNCSEGTVKKQLFRSMTKLRKQLSPLMEEL